MNIGYSITESLKTLRSDTSNPWPNEVKGRAPHKPFLLLAILDGVEQGWITDNRIELTQQLVETFFEYWKNIMGDERITTIALPFFHMKSEDFWKLVYKDGMTEYVNSPSLGGLTDRVAYAELDEELFNAMTTEEGQNKVRSLLMQTYFSDAGAEKAVNIRNFNFLSYEYAEHIESFAAEPFQVDHTKEDEIKYRKTSVQVRDSGFSRKVRSAYSFRCAVCRARVITQGGNTLVDGAHILPRSKFNNDDPRNGLALCKTHHWMFDQYLLSVRPDYIVQFSNWLKDRPNDAVELWKHNNEQILLPENQNLIPAEKALEFHYSNFKDVQ